MCGVIGFVSERHRPDLGLVAAELLKTLEYRGYDSTGAAVQGEGESVVLRKGVGAPSVMVERLGITELSGSIFCGQVRWATFGAIDEPNSQPHEVRGHGTQLSRPGLSRWRSIEEDFHLLPLCSAEFLQDGDQFHFVIEGVQA